MFKKITTVVLVMLFITVPAFSGFSIDAKAQTNIYDLMKNAVERVESGLNITGSGITNAQMETITTNFFRIYPQFFYLKRINWKYSNNLVKTIEFVYTNKKSEITKMKKEYESAVKDALLYVSSNMSDLEKMLSVHDYLILHSKYDYENFQKDSVPVFGRKSYGVLVEGTGVCVSYTLAFNDIMNKLGIKCIYVDSEKMNHCWNMVQLNSKWYHIDVTWDDPICDPDKNWVNDDYDIDGLVTHNYFLLSDQEITQKKHYGWNSDAPKATSTIYDNKYSGISSGMFYQNGYWFYSEKGVLMRSDIELGDKTELNGRTNCDKPYLYKGELYYIRNSTSSAFSEIRKTKLENGEDTLVLRYDNQEDGIIKTITEFVITKDRIRYTVHSTTKDKSVDSFEVKQFDINAIIDLHSEYGWYRNPVKLTYDKISIYVDEKLFVSGKSISGEGAHRVVVKDTSGNSMEFTIHIDTRNPVISGVQDNGTYSGRVVIKYDEGMGTLDGKPFESGSTVSKSGTHILKVTDLAGNETVVSFTIKSSLLGFFETGTVFENVGDFLFIVVCCIPLFLLIYFITRRVAYVKMRKYYVEKILPYLLDLENTIPTIKRDKK